MCDLTLRAVLVIPDRKMSGPPVMCLSTLGPLLGIYTCEHPASWTLEVRIFDPVAGKDVPIRFFLCDGHTRPYILGKELCGVHHEPFTVKVL